MIDDIDLWLDMCTGRVDETSIAPPRVKTVPDPFRD
jgi:hypothetical protein